MSSIIRLTDTEVQSASEPKTVLYALHYLKPASDGQSKNGFQKAFQGTACEVSECQCELYGISCHLGESFPLDRPEINFVDFEAYYE